MENKESFTFFYGIKSPFSNFHPAPFSIDNIEFNCAEQFIMYQKAKMFKDEIIAKEVLNEAIPKEHKKLGRKVTPFDPIQWGENCKQIVYKGCKAKFTQNELPLLQLLDTKGSTLVEASPRDTLWGIGYSEKNPKAHNRLTWRGKNQLGELLTKLRDDLIE